MVQLVMKQQQPWQNFTPTLPLQFILWSRMLLGMEYPSGQSGSAVLVAFPSRPSFIFSKPCSAAGAILLLLFCLLAGRQLQPMLLAVGRCSGRPRQPPHLLHHKRESGRSRAPPHGDRGQKSLNHRITECPELEGIYKNH